MNSSTSTGNDHEVCSTVPGDLTRLIRIVMRTFYGFELYMCMELLMFYQCIKEDDVAELLRLDLKIVHQHLINLKKEKFAHEKSIMVTSADGKLSKHSYFYVNYKMMVNIIKYKLDKIRIQIEGEENQASTRANFKCTNCAKKYTDLDTKDIFLTMTCLYCGMEVEEDTGSMPSRVPRNLLNKFNTQMLVIFELLGKVEHVRLAEHILRPEPVDVSHVLERINQMTCLSVPTSSSTTAAGSLGTHITDAHSKSMPILNSQLNAAGALTGKSAMINYNHKWSGEKTRHQDMLNPARISINFDSSSSAVSTNGTAPGAGGGGHGHRHAMPSILLLNRTTDDAIESAAADSSNRDTMLLDIVRAAADQSSPHTTTTTTTATAKEITTATKSVPSPLSGNNNVNSQRQQQQQASEAAISGPNLESVIMQKLLKYEKKAAAAAAAASSSSSSFQATAADVSPFSGQILSPRSNSSSNGSSVGSSSTKKRTFEQQQESATTTTTTTAHHHQLTTSVSSSSSTSASDYLLMSKKRRLNGNNHHRLDAVCDESSSGSSNSNSSNGSSVPLVSSAVNGHNRKSNLVRNLSDGSDREETDDDYLNEQLYSNSTADGGERDYDQLGSDESGNETMNGDHQQQQQQALDDHVVPRVPVRNKYVRLDRVTPRIIKMMSEREKDCYINMCRELYSVIYEI